jgi:hypothetical protein
LQGREFRFPYPVLEVGVVAGSLVALLDPDSYISAPGYREQRRSGMPAPRNLVGSPMHGGSPWEAEFPEESDYYYKIVSWDPLIALSFSGYRCRIDPATGKILSSEFTK